VLTAKRDGEKTTVVVAPITHTPPSDSKNAIEVPAATKERLGLDHARSWIVTNDLNIFVWPGPDIRFIDSVRGIAFGHLPSGLTKALITSVRDQIRLGKQALVNRDVQ
jgi:hypothetical protein